MTMTPEIRIPAEDLRRQYRQIKDEVHAAIDAVLPTGKYTLGPFLEAFEREFARYCGTPYCVGISNGTEALHLALAACGIGPGDEVITVANTYVATAFAISYVGARPVFVDIDPASYNMDMALVERAITPRTRALIPVHLYGQPVDMDPLREMAQEHHLWVIEDAAHSHGATYKGRRTGALGDIGCFSFYPSKNLGAYGDAGAITLGNDELHDRIRTLRYMGQHVKHTHEVVGFQQRLDPIQAAILSVKLRHLDEWNRLRQRWAALYDRLLVGLPVVTPGVSSFGTHVYYMYTIRTPRRAELMAHLAGQGIGTQIIYGTPVPMQPAYRSLGYRESDIPIAAQYAKEYLCLPMFPELKEEEVHEVAMAIRKFFA